MEGAKWDHIHSLSNPPIPSHFTYRSKVSTLEGSRMCHPKTCFSILIMLSCRHSKNSKYGYRISLNSPHLPKERSSKRNSTVINHLWEFHQTGKIGSCHKRGDQTSTVCHKLSYLPSILLRVWFIFPKNHLLSCKRPTFLLPFPYLESI